MAAGDSHECGVHLHAREALGGLDRLGDRLHRAVDVDDDTLTEAIGGRLPNTDDVNLSGSRCLAYEGDDFRRPDVDRDQDGRIRHAFLRAREI